MRSFTEVLKKLIELSKDKKLTKQLQQIHDDSIYSAPEVQWKIKAWDLHAALNDYLENSKRASEPWFIDILTEFSQQPREDVASYIDNLFKTRLCKSENSSK